MGVTDPLLRRLLGLPGVLLDWLDGAPRLPPDPTRPEDVYPLVRAGTRHPEAHLALEEGLHHHVREGRVLAYEVRRRTAFAIGGLNAPPGEKAALLESFAATTGRWGVVRQLVFPVRRRELPEVVRAGFRPVQVGVEAWLDLPELAFRGGRYATVRNMDSRARRAGVQVEEVAPETCREELEEVFHRWLASKHPSWRMKLLVGSPGLDAPFDRRYLVARRDGRVEAFVTLLPGRPGDWGVDVMARRPDAAAGTMERILVHAVATLRAEGAGRLSLGACPMAGVPLRGEGRLLRWVFHLLYRSRLGNRIFAFRNLFRFKEKFRPRWMPVYFAARPRLGLLALYRGCRMWGLY